MSMRAEQQLDRYRETMVRLRQADTVSKEAGATEAQAYAAFSVGYLFGAGLPDAAATISHLYRRAYPGAYLPALVEGET